MPEMQNKDDRDVRLRDHADEPLALDDGEAPHLTLAHQRKGVLGLVGPGAAADTLRELSEPAATEAARRTQERR